MAPAINVSEIGNRARCAAIVKIDYALTIWHCNLDRCAHWFCLSASGFKDVSPAPQFVICVQCATIAVSTMDFSNCHCMRKFNSNRRARSRCEITSDVVISPAVDLSGNSETTPCAVRSTSNGDESVIVWQRHLCGGCYDKFSR